LLSGWVKRKTHGYALLRCKNKSNQIKPEKLWVKPESTTGLMYLYSCVAQFLAREPVQLNYESLGLGWAFLQAMT
jgi:hypothetical protein